MQDEQFRTGTAVYDATGAKLGVLSQPAVRNGQLIVQRGWLLHKEQEIPLSAIRRTDANGIYLRLYKPYLEPSGGKGAPRSPARAVDSAVPDYYASSMDDTVADQMDWLPTQQGAAMPKADARPKSPSMRVTDVLAPPVTTTPAPTPQPTPALTAAEDVSDDLRVPLREEHLVVAKQQRERGRVHVHKYVVEEPQTVSIDLTHEEAYVSRVPVRGQVTPAPNSFTEQHVEMALMGEEMLVDKQAYVVEEVRLFRESVTESHTITDMVRRERLHIDGADMPTQPLSDLQHPDTTQTQRNGSPATFA